MYMCVVCTCTCTYLNIQELYLSRVLLFSSLSPALALNIKKVGCKYKLTWITIEDYVHTFGSGLIFGDIIVVLLSINTTVSDDSVAVELMGGKYIHTYMLFK